MLVVGLTGGIGSGKTTVAEYFKQYEVPVIDADQISHQLTARGGAAIPMIREQLGEAYVDPDGSLKREAMREAIFRDPGVRARLEGILHPLIRRRVEEELHAIDASYVLVVIPLLVEKGGYDDLLDTVLVVDCSSELQIARTMSRNGFVRAEVEAILRTQASREQRLKRADAVILNDGNASALTRQVQVLNAKYSSLACKKP
ncbi:MAG: dephospho-CoA kinase [Thiobacillaceae bacterium]